MNTLTTNPVTEIVANIDRAISNVWAKVKDERKVRYVWNITIDFEEITVEFLDGNEMEIDTVLFLDWYNELREGHYRVDVDSICARVHPEEIMSYLNLVKNINVASAEIQD